MKKLIVAAMMLLMSMCGMAQTPHKVYCEIMGYGNLMGDKVSKIEIDIGQPHNEWSNKNKILVDENNKNVEFESMMGAMNYLAKFGWQFIQAYVLTEEGITKSLVYHFVLSKEITSEDQIYEGIRLKEGRKSSMKQPKFKDEVYQ